MDGALRVQDFTSSRRGSSVRSTVCGTVAAVPDAREAGAVPAEPHLRPRGRIADPPAERADAARSMLVAVKNLPMRSRRFADAESDAAHHEGVT
jgi:hypothetical protein